MPQAPNQSPIKAIDAALAKLFRCDIRDIREDRYFQISDSHAGNIGQEFFCPIEGCARNRDRGFPWRNRNILRILIDLYYIGELWGPPSAEWLWQQRLQDCRTCGRADSSPAFMGIAGHLTGLRKAPIRLRIFPSFHDLFTTPIFREDHLPAEF